MSGIGVNDVKFTKKINKKVFCFFFLRKMQEVFVRTFLHPFKKHITGSWLYSLLWVIGQII